MTDEFIENKKKIFEGIIKKTQLQFLTMSKEELQIYSKTFSENIEKIEHFINKYIDNINNIRKFDPIQEKVSEIKKKLKVLNNKIKDISKKYHNNYIVFENGDKVIQRLKNENYLLRKQIYEHNKKYLYSTLSPTSHYSKFKGRNFSNKNIKFNNLNNNNTNTILTTATSNETNGKNIIPITSRALMEQNIFSNLNNKMTIDINYNHDSIKKNVFHLKRPTSSFNRINPYFIVSENL